MSSKIIKAKFTKERECKHSIRYQADDEIGRSISTIIYIKKEALDELDNPEKVTISIERID